MEAVVVALCPRQVASLSQEFQPEHYEIMLIDGLKSFTIREGGSSLSDNFTNEGKNKGKGDGCRVLQLARTSLRFDEDASEVFCSFLYDLTGADGGGLRARRAVFVPKWAEEPEADYDSLKGALYALPVDPRETQLLSTLPDSPAFYNLHTVLTWFTAAVGSRDRDNSGSHVTFNFSTRTLILRLEAWLRQKHGVPGAIDLLFSSCAEDRLKRSVTNPAFFSERQAQFNSLSRPPGLEEGLTRSVANEALAKMLAIEKCERTIRNPVSLRELRYKPQVDKAVVNLHYGRGVPDYSKIRAPSPPEGGGAGVGGLERRGSARWWRADFPLHHAARIGDQDAVAELLREEHSLSLQDHDGWCPVHYAAWYGHVHVVDALLMAFPGAVTLTNQRLSTPLHVAASNGRAEVVELLVQQPLVDPEAVDRSGNTALAYCQNDPRPEWQRCAAILKHKPVLIPVFLMDGSFREVKLLSGPETTVSQVHAQMVQILELEESYARLFAIWICSPNLQLQLKPYHLPIDHLVNWKSKIAVQRTDQDPAREDPQLFWKRDAHSTIAKERKVRSPVACELLFKEAYHHYIHSFYPCSEDDVIILAGILMQLRFGDYDARRCQRFLDRGDKSLQYLVPSARLRSGVRWANKIQAQYKHYSSCMANKEPNNCLLHQHFLRICFNLTVYGSAFFTGTVTLKGLGKSPVGVHVGVNDVGVHIINTNTRNMLQSYAYRVITWSEKNGALEIRQRGSEKVAMTINSKQADLTSFLMGKLSAQNEPKPS